MLHTIPLPVMNPNIQECMHVHVCVGGGVYASLGRVIFTYFYIFFLIILCQKIQKMKIPKGFLS